MASVVEELAPLPTPTDRPSADVLIYDGHCKFCTASVRKLNRADRRGRLAFLSLHDPEVARRYPDLTHDELMQYMVVIPPDGRRLRGAEVFKYLSTKLPLLYWMAPLLYLPGLMPLWQWCYRKFAKQRYRWGRIESCETGSCQIPRRP
jgi:predicted DCC family thiol-disulfide oxidoreductase YuxK